MFHHIGVYGASITPIWSLLGSLKSLFPLSYDLLLLIYVKVDNLAHSRALSSNTDYHELLSPLSLPPLSHSPPIRNCPASQTFNTIVQTNERIMNETKGFSGARVHLLRFKIKPKSERESERLKERERESGRTDLAPVDRQ